MNPSTLPFNWLGWAADLSPLPNFFLKVTVILLLGWMGTLVLRGRNPYWRVFLWRCVLVGIMILPVFTAMAPNVSLVVAEALTEKATQGPAVPTAPTESSAFLFPSNPMVSINTLPAIPLNRVDKAPSSVHTPPATPVEILAVPASANAMLAQGIMVLLYWIWGTGVVLFLLRLALSHLKVRSFVRESQSAPIEVVSRVEQVAQDLKVRGRVEVRTSPTLKTPFLAGVLRPVLLLPFEMTTNEYREDLPAVIAHELSHVRTLDLVWGWVFHLTGIVLWPHPLMWRVRKSHMAACEEVCDAAAANYIGSQEIYSGVLARIAYALHSSSPAACGIAMARVSNVSRRLAALKRFVLVRPLSMKRIAVGLVVSFSALFLIAALDFVRAEPKVEAPQIAADSDSEPEEQEVASSVPKLKLRLVDKATQAVIANTTVEMSLNVNGGCGNYVDTPFKTGPDGEAALISTATNPVAFGFRVSIPGYVPMGGMWYRESEPRIASMPSFALVEFEKGTTIGGLVKDEAGKPVAGVNVEPDIYRRDDGSKRNPVRYSLRDLGGTTDSEGRWTCMGLPQSLEGYNLSLSYSHPAYVLGKSFGTAGPSEVSHLRATTHEVTMKKGSSLSGRLVDELGRPIEGASAKTGRHEEEKESRTGPDGIFVLEHVPGHSTTVVVTADGFAPTVTQAVPSTKGSQVLIEMERGLPLRGRVVDEMGKPIQGARVATESDGLTVLEEMLNESIDTNADGHFEWVHSPSETLRYSVTAKGYQRVRKLALKPGDTEHTIALRAPVRVHGRVLDSISLEPIEEFDLIPGIQWQQERTDISWWERTGREQNQHGGKYEYQITEGYPGMALKVKAKGYLPAESKIIPRDASREIEHDFFLVKGSGLAGQALDLEGGPLPGASVILCTTAAGGYIQNGLDASVSSSKPQITDAEGRFSFAEPASKFKLICIDEKGSATVTQEEFSTGKPIQIQPWGRVEGQLLIGTKPAPSEAVVLSFPFGDEQRQPRCFLDYRTSTDSKGRFSFDHVFPGIATAARQINLGSTGSGYTGGNTHTTVVEIRSGETVVVQIGGTGRPVIGKLQLPPGVKDGDKLQWGLVFGSFKRKLSDEEKKANDERREREGYFDEPSTYYVIADEDGSFRVEDIPEGSYTLYIRVPKPGAADPDSAAQLGQINHEFTVPPMDGGRSDEPLDLGTLEVKVTGK